MPAAEPLRLYTGRGDGGESHSTSVGWYVGTNRKGRMIFERNDVMANIRSASVPIRVACSHRSSILSFGRFGCSEKIGLT